MTTVTSEPSIQAFISFLRLLAIPHSELNDWEAYLKSGYLWRTILHQRRIFLERDENLGAPLEAATSSHTRAGHNARRVLFTEIYYRIIDDFEIIYNVDTANWVVPDIDTLARWDDSVECTAALIHMNSLAVSFLLQTAEKNLPMFGALTPEDQEILTRDMVASGAGGALGLQNSIRRAEDKAITRYEHFYYLQQSRYHNNLQLRKLEKNVGLWATENKALMKMIKERDQLKESLQAELNDAVEIHKEEQESFEVVIEKLRKQEEESVNTLRTLEDKYEVTAGSLQETTSLLAQTEHKLQSMEKLHDDAKVCILERESELKKEREEAEEYAMKWRAARHVSSRLEDEIKEIKDYQTKLAELTELENTLNNVRQQEAKDKEDLKIQLEAALSTAVTNKQTIAQLTQQVEQGKRDLTHTETKAARYLDELTSKEDHVRDLEEELSRIGSLDQQPIGLDLQTQILQTQQGQQNLREDQQSAWMEEQRTAHQAELEQNVAKLQLERNDLNSRMSSMRADHLAVQVQLVQKMADLTNEHDLCTELRQQLLARIVTAESAHDDCQEQRQQLITQIATLESQHTDCLRIREQLDTHIITLKNDHKNCADAQQQLVHQITSLEHSVLDAEDAIPQNCIVLICALTQSIRTLKRRLGQAHQDKNHAVSTREQLVRQITSLEHSVLDAEDAIPQNCIVLICALTQSICTLKRRLGQAHQDKNHAVSTREQLVRQITSLEHSVLDAENAIPQNCIVLICALTQSIRTLKTCLGKAHQDKNHAESTREQQLLHQIISLEHSVLDAEAAIPQNCIILICALTQSIRTLKTRLEQAHQDKNHADSTREQQLLHQITSLEHSVLDAEAAIPQNCIVLICALTQSIRTLKTRLGQAYQDIVGHVSPPVLFLTLTGHWYRWERYTNGLQVQLNTIWSKCQELEDETLHMVEQSWASRAQFETERAELKNTIASMEIESQTQSDAQAAELENTITGLKDTITEMADQALESQAQLEAQKAKVKNTITAMKEQVLESRIRSEAEKAKLETALTELQSKMAAIGTLEDIITQLRSKLTAVEQSYRDTADEFQWFKLQTSVNEVIPLLSILAPMI
ncbi:hypothetical protein FB451DRAFT_1184878 [Mycena latifolia]|nr:hypothetical protein FB451DRAFT_1184878 [Mycena latifolia]